MGKIINESGNIYGYLTVIEYFGKNNEGRYIWKCRCKCGNYVNVVGKFLREGKTKSCGCYRIEKLREKIFIDLTNKTIDNWLVIKLISKDNFGALMWLCKCKCGNEQIVNGNSLRRGLSKRCVICRNIKNTKRGKLSNLWKDGKSLIYPSEWNERLRGAIRDRDSHKCQYPNCEYDDIKESKKLCVHHIDGNKQNCKPYNLISLCKSHHGTVEQNDPRSWEAYFYEITDSYEL